MIFWYFLAEGKVSNFIFFSLKPKICAQLFTDSGLELVVRELVCKETTLSLGTGGGGWELDAL